MRRWAILLFVALTLPDSAALRIVSFNIHAWRDTEHEDNFERLCTLLRELRPDVLCLNEVLHPFAPPPPSDPYWEAVRSRQGRGVQLSPPLDGAAGSNLERLRAHLDLEFCTFGAATERGFFGAVPFGNAILSRFPLDDIGHTVMHPEPGDLTLGIQKRTPDDLEVRFLLLPPARQAARRPKCMEAQTILAAGGSRSFFSPATPHKRSNDRFLMVR